MQRTLLIALVLPIGMAALAHEAPRDVRLEFHENKGQWPAGVLFRTITPGGAVYVERRSFTYLLREGGHDHDHGHGATADRPSKAHAVRVHFEGGQALGGNGHGEQAHRANYFQGNDPARWAGGARVYAGAELNRIYPGIDMRVDGRHGLKYDWLVAAGADPAHIVLRYEGMEGIEIKDGAVVVHTTAGDISEMPPVAWQMVDGVRRDVPCRFVLDGERVRFELPEGHDAAWPLVIDPQVVFSSFTGSNTQNFGSTATYDNGGHLYGGGTVFGFGYPFTLGVVQPAIAGSVDMGLTKFSPDGSTLIWSTYLGGAGDEIPHSLVVNDQDELFVLGTSGSNNFPTTPGCFDGSFNGGSSLNFAAGYALSFNSGVDIVVSHFNSAASALLGSTYVGGPGTDGVNVATGLSHNYGDPFRGEIILDASGHPVVASCTNSTALAVSAGSQAYGGGELDGYVFRMDPGLTSMLWSTYIGGGAADAAYGVQLSSTGVIYVTGGTMSNNLPGVAGGLQSSLSGGVDGYIARFDPATVGLLGATYLGTAAYDQSYFVQLDSQDAVYVVGQTRGAYPVTPGKYANPSGSQFIHKLDADLATSQWSTRIGSNGTEDISPAAFLVSNCDQIYFSGWGGGTNAIVGQFSSTTVGLPVTADAYQPNTDGSDFYLMVLEQEAEDLLYGTFFGGSAQEHCDGGTSRFDKNGVVYQAVCAACSFGSFPTTPGAWSTTQPFVNCNLGVFKIDFQQGVSATIGANGQIGVSSLQVCAGLPIDLQAIGGADSWTWDLGDGSPEVEGATHQHVYAEPGTYPIILVGVDSASCNVADTTRLQLEVIDPTVAAAAFDAFVVNDCEGLTVGYVNQSVNAGAYLWDLGNGITSTAVSLVQPYELPGTYTVTLRAINSVCGDTLYHTEQVVIEPPVYVFSLPAEVAICDGVPAQLTAPTGLDSYAWSNGPSTSTISVDQPGTYTLVVTLGTCTATSSTEVSLGAPPPNAEDRTTCPGIPVVLTPAFEAASVQWNTGSEQYALEVTEPGTYWFTAIDQQGCQVSDTIEVVFLETGAMSQVQVPSVFTPNGDGRNDRFLVHGPSVSDVNMSIFARTGALVYETKGIDRGWNGGKDNTSDRVPDGTYYYVVRFVDRCAAEPEVVRTGHVTLLR